MKDGGWLSKYNDIPEAQNGIEGTMGGLTDVGFNYNGAWGGTMAMGGSLPGSVGFTYARTQSPAPSNGKYAKKTKASAQNGMEMKYYQEGLDWKPKSISRDGSWLEKFQPGGKKAKAKPNPLINLRDFTITPNELTYLNDPKNGYCVNTGNCLESSRNAYDMTAGTIKGVPDSTSIWTNDLGLSSTANKPTEKQVQENPYYIGDNNYGSADSWDLQGAIIKAGGKNIYSGAKNQVVPKDIPVGAIAAYGPAGTKDTTRAERKQGMNTKYGLQPSHHSVASVGYNENGESIFYDSYSRKYGTLEEIGKILKDKLGYELENIGVPKSVSGNTREGLNKKGLLKNELTPYRANIDALISAANQSWAQINEDGKSRSPKVDKEKLTSFAQALIDNKGELISNLGLSNSEYDRLANTALAIAMTESEGGGALGFSDRFGSTQGMTQLNLDNITNDQRLSSALKRRYKKDANVKDLRDPYSSAIATMMYLSVADKDSERLFNKGLKPGERIFNQPGVIENFRSSNSRLNKEGVFIDELNKRIPYSEIPGYDSGDVKKVNNYFKKLTNSDRYSFVNKDGDLSLKLKTKGNNPELTDEQKIAYMWQSPNSLKTGDAEGKSEYVTRIQNYYNSLNKQKDGGWLNKYNDGGIIEDDRGQWAHPGEITKINSNQITMQGVNYPVLGISDTGDTKMMYPNEEYTYDGESVTEIPMAQKGKIVPLRELMKQEDEKLKAKSDNTKVVPQKTISNKEANALRARKDAEELARRKQAIAASNKVNDMSDFDLSNVNQYLRNPTGLIQAATSTPLQFITSLVNKEKYTPENFAIATGAVGDKARLFPNDPNSFFDDYLNPLVQVGNMASNLGRAPLDIQQGNYGSAALSVVTPFLTGVGEQYLSNAIAPYLPARGQVASELKDLKKAVFPTKPTFINPSEQELLSTVRNVGILSKTGTNDASVLEKILAKGSGLTDDEFKNLVGSSRSEIQGKIQTLRETPTGAKKVGENQFEWDVNPNANQSPPILGVDANGNPISNISNFNLNRPATSQAARDAAFIRRQGRQQGRELQNLYNQAISQQGGRDLSPQQMNALQTFVDDTYELIRTDPDNAPNFSDFINHPQYQDLYNFKLEPNKSFIRGLTNRINEGRYLPISSEKADSLLPSLYRNESNNPAAEIIKAYRTLERAPKGSTFKSAGSLSTDSYPATLRMTEKAINNDLGNLNYTGMSTLNPSGFSQSAGIPTDINLKEINTMIDQLNKKLIKPIPYAYQEGTQIFAPQISVTRKKNGGWLNKYE
jgi:hypothetical protein